MIKSSLRLNSDSSKVARLMRLTALPRIVRNLVRKVLKFSALTRLTSVSPPFSHTLGKPRGSLVFYAVTVSDITFGIIAFLIRITNHSMQLDYLHSANPETPIEETMRAMAELKAYVIISLQSRAVYGKHTNESIPERAR